MEHHFFSPDNVDLHNESDQLERQEGVSQYNISKVDKINFTAVVKRKGHPEESFFVSLQGCSCDDFRLRGKPCAHMYAFASRQIELDDGRKIKFFTRNNERSETLIADFSKGYADGWAFVVRPCNYEALDIKWTPKTIKKSTFMQLTQGDVYNFTDGSVFYDTLEAYNLPWSNALESIRCSLQITRTIPTYTFPVVTVNDNNILERYDKAVYGTVYFDMFRPDVPNRREKLASSFSCRQDEFLRLLQSGAFVDLDGMFHVI